MDTERYTPGHSLNATDFMARRTLASHGQFFAAHLRPGAKVLDCGCGPGSITIGIASAIAPGAVVGVDLAESQIEKARKTAAACGAVNASFEIASCYSLPFPNSSFDCVFSHALMEHLADPVRALSEFFRVLRPGGLIGVCSPDFGGFLLAPSSEPLMAALSAYVRMQQQNGGDPYVGHKFGEYLAAAGFGEIGMNARYECYPSLSLIGEYLALQLEQKGEVQHAKTLLAWSTADGGMFAQTWVSAIGRK